jgi:hypothetical protein
VRVVPAVLWRHLGEQFKVPAPDLASLRAMYGRGNTRFEHQQLACVVLDFHWLSEQQRRALRVPYGWNWRAPAIAIHPLDDREGEAATKSRSQRVSTRRSLMNGSNAGGKRW